MPKRLLQTRARGFRQSDRSRWQLTEPPDASEKHLQTQKHAESTSQSAPNGSCQDSSHASAEMQADAQAPAPNTRQRVSPVQP